MARFLIRTTSRHFTIDATSLHHARAIVTGMAMPVGIPPAPQPAELPRKPGQAFPDPTPEWQAWYDEHRPRMWSERLAWQHGECLLGIAAFAARPGTAEEVPA
jgi:hypothetical protein